MSDDAGARRPSIRDVARVAEVSHQTVSRVLNEHPSIRPETRARVLQVMDELNYRPSQAARALVTSRSKTIGILAAARSMYGRSVTIEGIEEAARARGYWVTTANVDGSDLEAIRAGVTHLIGQAIEGLVVLAPQQRAIRELAKLNISIPYVTLQSTDLDEHMVSVDQVTGARLVTRHLIEQGHRAIYHLTGPQDWIEAEARMQGFLAEMSDHDISTTAPVLGDWTAEFGYHAGRELLRVPDFTAVFASNDHMALGLIHAIRSAGLDVPRDFSVVGFDDIPEAAHFWPPLTTVRQDFAELGRRSVNVLLGPEDPEDAGAPTPTTLGVGPIVPELIVRESVRRIPVR